jgi:hypothetical protein
VNQATDDSDLLPRPISYAGKYPGEHADKTERELVMAGQDQAPKAVGQKATVREIEEAREDLARTIDAIADIVSPANVARRTAGKLRQRVQSRVQSVDPKLAGAGAVVVVSAVGVVAFLVWRRRR